MKDTYEEMIYNECLNNSEELKGDSISINMLPTSLDMKLTIDKEPLFLFSEEAQQQSWIFNGLEWISIGGKDYGNQKRKVRKNSK